MKSLVRVTVIIVSFIFLSCGKSGKFNDDISNRDLNESLNKSLVEYSMKKDKKVLENAYSLLNRNKDFREHGLVNGIVSPTIGILMGLEKYEELEKLLINNSIIDEYNKTNILNTVRYLKLKNKNLPKAKSYIVENIKMIKNTIDKNPNDSLKYADYFSMRMFLIGKNETLKEIDSMKKVNKKYSEVLYDDILKEAIRSYPDEYLITK